MTPISEIFESLFYASSRFDCPPLYAEKIGLSLSHLVPEILGPKVGLSFHQNVLFNCFRHVVSIFPLIMDLIDILFH